MSRVDVSGEIFDLAFGVDHATGAFVQLWVKPANDQDCAIVKIDSFGVQVDEEQSTHLNTGVKEFLKQQEKRFVEWRVRDSRPNIDEQMVIRLAALAGGFEDITKQVYETFD